MGRAIVKGLALLFFLLATASCAPFIVGGKYTASSENFAADLPQGWKNYQRWLGGKQAPAWGQPHHDPQIYATILSELERRRDLAWDVVHITRDGWLLQQIAIGRIPAERTLPHTKMKFPKGLLPQEAAEVLIDNIRSNPNLSDQRIIENNLAKVGGYPGFYIAYVYQPRPGLKIKGALYGVMHGDWLYYLLYEAPQRHYFEKDQAVFEKVKESFKFLRPGTA